MQVPPCELKVLLTKSEFKTLHINLFDVREKFWTVVIPKMIMKQYYSRKCTRFGKLKSSEL